MGIGKRRTAHRYWMRRKIGNRCFVPVLICWMFIAAVCVDVVSAQTYSGLSYTGRLTAPVDFRDVSSHWARVPIYRTAAQGIVQGSGGTYFYPNRAVTRGEALTMLVRAKGLELQAQQAAADAAMSGQKWRTASEYWANGYLQTALNEGIITEDEFAEIQSGSTRGARRQEVANWAAGTLGIQPTASTGQRALYALNDWNQIDPQYLTGAAAVVENGIMVGSSGGAFNPRKTITRGEMAVILDKISQRLGQQQGIAFKEGSVRTVNAAWESSSDGLKRRISLSVQGSDGENWQLAAESVPNNPSFMPKDFIVFKNNGLGGHELLQAGDRIKAVLTDDGYVLFVEVAKPAADLIRGSFSGFRDEGRTITVLDASGRSLSLPMHSYASISINGRWAKSVDLVPGQEVTAALKNGQVTEVKAETASVLPVYAQPREQLVSGQVKSIHPSQGRISISSGSGWNTYVFDEYTRVLRNGREIGADNLQVGDSVQLYVQDNRIARIDAAGRADTVQNIIRGEIDEIHPINNRVVLSGAEEFFYGGWYPAGDVLSLDIEPGAPVFDAYGNAELSWLEKASLGSEIYAACVDNFRGQKAVRLLVKAGDSRTYSGKIDNIDAASGGFDVDPKPSWVLYGEDTMAYHNGKIIDIEDVPRRSTVFLETMETEEGERAAVVLWKDFFTNDFDVLRGSIDEVMERSFELEGYSEFHDHTWDDARSNSREAELELSSEAVIIDARNGTNSTVDPDDFLYTRFSGDYEGEKALVLLEDDTVNALIILEGDFGGDKTSVARVSSTASGLTLERVRDWSAAQNQWKTNEFPVTLETDGSVVVKEGEIVDDGAISKGDTVYVLHNMENAFIIFIQ